MNERGKPPIGMNDRVWWLGGAEKDNYLRENTWLIAAGGKSVLIDPGPVPGFPAIFKAFSSVGDLQNLTAIAVTQGHPDACASLPLWEKAGFSGKIIAHWKTALLLPSLGIRSAFRYVHHEETDESGHFLGLRLIPLPNLGNGGSLALFDSDTGTLFSGNLFGFYGRNSPLLGAPDTLERVA